MKSLHFNRLRVFICALVLAANLAAISTATQTGATLDAATRAEVIEGAIKALNDEYVFPETAKKMEQAIRERLRRKEYDDITSASSFAATFTAHLQEVSKDKHLRVIFDDGSRPMFGGGPNPAERERARMMAAKRNFGFEKVERLSGNVGYLDLRGFENPKLATDTAAAAMNFLANTDALIIDLRQNGGGSPETVAFISSYLFDKRTHLNDIYERPANTARGSSAGGGYSTAEDLLKFTIALQNNKLLSPENSRKIGGELGVAGGAPGINAALEFDSRSGYTIIVLSNYDPPSAESVGEQIRRWVANIER